MKNLFAAIVCCFLLSACAGQSANIPTTDPNVREYSDIQRYSQDLMTYAAQGDALLISREQSLLASKQYQKRFFAAWSSGKLSKDSLAYLKGILNKNVGFAENLRPWSEQRLAALRENCQWTAYPALRAKAITVATCSVREVPTISPSFSSSFRAGDAFPFDNFQQSTLPVGTPLMIQHVSRDGLWFLAESSLVTGWIAVRDVALVDANFCRVWQNLPLAAIIRENTPLGSAPAFAAASIGTVLPQENSSLLVPVRDASGHAVIRRVPATTNIAAPLPLPFTAANVARLGNQMMGQPYGWGGLYENRDCSETMRSLFTPFGIWLPRNSRAQMRSGEQISLEKLSPSEKKARILAQAIPFRSLLFLPGHIGLYIGSRNGEPLFFHSPWGLKTPGNGRFVIGKTVVTAPEAKDIAVEATLLERMTTISILGN